MELHGGNVYKIFREKGIKDILDYSSNINPLGVPAKFREIVNEQFDNVTKYPDPEYIELKESLAKYNNVDIEKLIVGNGATEVIFLFMKQLRPKRVLIVSPTFAEYQRALNSVKCEIDYFELKEAEEFEINIDELETKMNEKYDLLIVCNPNNPTGKLIKRPEMRKVIDICKKNETFLFIDEAFIEFPTGGLANSIINDEFNYERVFVLRALTKFFAIPGLRFGYGICYNQQLKNEIEKYREPWTVNYFAELAGIHMLSDEEYIKKSENWIEEEKEYMYMHINKIEGLKTYRTDTNFILLKFDKMKSGEIREKLIDKGILVRDASNFVFLDNSYIRLAIKDRISNEKVVEVLKKIVVEMS